MDDSPRVLGCGPGMRSRACLSAILLATFGCGNSHPHAAPDAPNIDARADAPIDTPPDSGGFAEAPHDTPPQVSSQGGAVLTAPTIVPIFFTGDDAMQAQVESFLGQLVGSSYWTATTSEYGVGPITVTASVVSTDAPPTTDAALQTWIEAHKTGTAGWPASTPQTIYAVFLPEGVVFTADFGTGCVDYGAFHEETSSGVIYALMPRCMSQVWNYQDDLTRATSHELIEASTDPHPYSAPAFNVTDQAHNIWTYVPGGELGDMCAYVQAAYQRLVGNFLVQRTWSNTAAAAGHDPCVPQMGPYINGALALPNDGSLGTEGISVPLGTSSVVEVDLFSDAPVTDAWSETAIDVDSVLGGSPTELTFTWDQPSGNNGDKLHLTITRVANGQNGGSIVRVSSVVANQSVGQWWGYIAN